MQARLFFVALSLGLTSPIAYAEGTNRILLWQDQVPVEEQTSAPQPSSWSLRYVVLWQDQVFDWRRTPKLPTGGETVTRAKSNGGEL